MSSLLAHQLLEKLALKPVESAGFPSHFSIVMRLKAAMNDENTAYKRIVDILSGEPMVAAKIVQTANATSFHGYSKILDLEKAVSRLGMSAVRRISLGVVMSQLAKAKETLVFSSMARKVWLHSLYTAAAASVLAKEYTRVQPDEAFFAGLMLNIGAFYLLYQAGHHAELRECKDDVRFAIERHYLNNTIKVLHHLELPDEVINAVDIRKIDDMDLLVTPKNITEVIYAANLLASVKYPWTDEVVELSDLGEPYASVVSSIDECFQAAQEDFR